MPNLAESVLEILRGHPLVKDVRVVEFDETPAGSVELKVRCRMGGDYQFQVWIHAEADSLDYSFQLFSDGPILRWDNAPHYPNIATSPHHFHDERGRVSKSPMKGDLPKNLKTALGLIEKWLEKSNADKT